MHGARIAYSMTCHFFSSMYSVPSNSHRTFIAVSGMLAIVLLFGLVVGWRWHFHALESRRALQELSAKTEARMQERIPSGGDVFISSPGAQMPESGSLLVSDSRPLEYLPDAPLVPARSVIEALPMVNAANTLVMANRLMRAYNETPDWRDRVKFVHDSTRVEKLMEDYYENQHAVDPVAGALIGQARYRIDGAEIVLFTYRSARPEGKLEVAMRKDATGKLLLDWESYVGYSEIAFPQIIADTSTKPVMVRALAKLDDYYNYEFSDRERYVSLKLTAADSDDSFHAYCEREGPIGIWLREDLGSSPQTSLTKGYTLWVAHPPAAQSPRALKIVQIAAGRWIIVPPNK